MSRSHSSFLKGAKRSVDMNSKQFFSQGSKNPVRSQSLCVSSLSLEPEMATESLFSLQCANSICQLTRAGERWQDMSVTWRGAAAPSSEEAQVRAAASRLRQEAASSCPRGCVCSLCTPGPGLWAPSIMPVITQVSSFLGS